MNWTDERIGAVLSDLDTPDADEAFWARVRRDLLTSKPELTSTMGDELPADQPLTQVEEFGRHRRGRGLLVVATAAAVVVAGLYVIGRGPERQPANAPTGNVVLTDPLSLSLDDLPRTTALPTPQLDYLMPDFARLPPGWTAARTNAYGLISPPGKGYRNISSLLSPTGESFIVDVITGLSLKPQGGSQIDVNGHDALQSANEVWWEQQPGVEVMVSRAPASAEGDTAGAARGLVFVTVHELPTVTIDPTTEPSRSGAQFAGTLNGIHYTVNANTGPLRGIRVSVGDQGSIGGVDNDRLSQPTDDPETNGGVNIAGVPGYGMFVFGYTEPAAAALRAVLADGSTVQLPVLRNPGETYFAMPIPLGVEVTTLEFLDDAGRPLRSAIMPNLPAYFGGCCASAPWSADLEPAHPAPSSSEVVTSCAEGATEISLPNVAGLSYGQAAAELARLGVTPQPMFEQTPWGTTTDADPVVNQRTAPGTTVACGAQVELVVAFNPGPLHVVQPGDTFASVAAAAGLTLDQLLAFNGLESDADLEVGHAVRLTAPPGPPPTT